MNISWAHNRTSSFCAFISLDGSLPLSEKPFWADGRFQLSTSFFSSHWHCTKHIQWVYFTSRSLWLNKFGQLSLKCLHCRTSLRLWWFCHILGKPAWRSWVESSKTSAVWLFPSSLSTPNWKELLELEDTILGRSRKMWLSTLCEREQSVQTVLPS